MGRGRPTAWRATGASLLVAGVLLGACTGAGSGKVSGVVIDVTGDLTSVESFTLLVGGEQHTYAVLAEGGDYAFPPGHLRDHLRSGEPVVVEWEARAGVDTAVAIQDG